MLMRIYRLISQLTVVTVFFLAISCSGVEEQSADEEKPKEREEQVGREKISDAQKEILILKVDSVNEFLSSKEFMTLQPRAQIRSVMYAVKYMNTYEMNYPTDTISARYLFDQASLYANFLNDRDMAIKKLNELLMDHQGSPYEPEAMMSLAINFEELGLKEKAYNQVKMLQMKYPDHYLGRSVDDYIENVLQIEE